MHGDGRQSIERTGEAFEPRRNVAAFTSLDSVFSTVTARARQVDLEGPAVDAPLTVALSRGEFFQANAGIRKTL